MGRTTSPLTDTELRNAKPKGKEYPLSDGGGLYILIKPSGKKKWRYRYQHPITRDRVLLGIGDYPSLSLAQARQKRNEGQALVANGLDPQTEWNATKSAKKKAHSETLVAVAEQWFDVKRHEVTADYAHDIWRSLEMHIFPKLGHIPISQLSAQQLVETLKPVEARGSLETVKRVCQRINEVMDFAANTGLITANPASGIRKAFRKPKKQHLPSVEPKMLPFVLATMQRVNLSPETRAALMWSLYTAARPSEASQLRWDEINLEKRWVRIPAERMKKKRDHYIPLTEQMTRILDEMKRLNGDCPFVFRSPIKPNQPLNSQTVNAALKRAGLYKILVAHGVRAIASTALNDHGFNEKLVEVTLSHAEKNETKAAYDRGNYIEPRRPVMQWWNDFVDDAMVLAIKGTYEAMPLSYPTKPEGEK